MNLRVPQSFALLNKSFTNEDFEIDFFELEQKLNFTAKRLYFLNTNSLPSTRGQHAHVNQNQIVLKLTGKATVLLTDKNGITQTWQLEKDLLYIPSNYWIEIKMAARSKILCLASLPYDQLNTIFDKDQFLASK